MTDEDRLKRKCVKWLKKTQIDHPTLYFYSPTDHFYSGIPDFFIVWKGILWWIELKTPKGKVSDIQAWTHEKLRNAGANGEVIRDTETFKKFVTEKIMKGGNQNGNR